MQFEFELKNDIKKDFIKMIYEYRDIKSVAEVNYDETLLPFVALVEQVYWNADSDVIRESLTDAIEQYVKSLVKDKDLAKEAISDIYNLDNKITELTRYLPDYDCHPTKLVDTVIIKDGKEYSLSYDENPDEVIKACLELL